MTLRHLLSAAFLLLLTSCASIKPPPGGEEDKSAPEIDTTMPTAGMTNVPRKTTIHFEFAQDIDRSSFMQSITITPYMQGVVKYDWSGYDEVDIELPDSLRENTTYVVTLSRDLKTLRGGTLGTPTQITFSTGNVIDSGIIAGKVFPSFRTTERSDLGGVFIFCYDISRQDPDTLDMSRTRPDYITQPDKDGSYALRALAIGHTYRIIGVVDEFRNKLYDHTIDDYAVTKHDVVLDKPMISDVTMRLATKFDTTKPILQDIEVRDAYHLRANFSEAIDSNDVNEKMYSLFETGNDTMQTLVFAYREFPEKKPNVISFETLYPLKKNKEYILNVTPGFVNDKRGNIINDLNMSVKFIIPENTIDTFPTPRFIGASITDSTVDVSRKLNAHLRFSEPIGQGIEVGITLKDSSGKDTPFEVIRIDGEVFFIRSKDSLQSNQWYTLRLSTDKAKSMIYSYPPNFKDTTYVIRFKTTDIEETGNITGTVTFNDSLYKPAEHRIVVEVVNPSINFRELKVLLEGRNTYSFASLPRGRYKVRAFLTVHPENHFDQGKITPFQFAMPSGEYEAEIDIRPRWTVDKVDFEIK
ncbi:MAG TPA: Ig-like domain-containing protein [Candidatus Kapabacteria bacterium]